MAARSTSAWMENSMRPTATTPIGSNAQTLNNLLGKIIRMNPVPDPTAQIPTDNPFFGTATGKNRLIWATGTSQPVYVQRSTGHWPDLCQRRRRSHLGRDQRCTGRTEFRMADDRRALQRFHFSAVHEPGLQLSAQRQHSLRLRHHGRSVLQSCGSHVPSLVRRQILLRRILLRVDLLHRSQQPGHGDASSPQPFQIQSI